MGNANLFKDFTRLKIQDNATPAKQMNTEVRSIVRVSIKVPVRKYSRTHAITSEKSRIKKKSFHSIFVIRYNIIFIPDHCGTICPFTTLYLPAGNDCTYCIKFVIECPLLHSNDLSIQSQEYDKKDT